jgi:hypothetical protein
MAAVDLNQYYGLANRTAIYTFGQTRTGNQNWANYVNDLPFHEQHYRIIRPKDPFPHFPPRWSGYRHSGKLYVIKENGYIQIDDEPTADQGVGSVKQLFKMRASAQYFKFGKETCINLLSETAVETTEPHTFQTVQPTIFTL